MDSECNL